jgi:hypothetical protein
MPLPTNEIINEVEQVSAKIDVAVTDTMPSPRPSYASTAPQLSHAWSTIVAFTGPVRHCKMTQRWTGTRSRGEDAQSLHMVLDKDPESFRNTVDGSIRRFPSPLAADVALCATIGLTISLIRSKSDRHANSGRGSLLL